MQLYTDIVLLQDCGYSGLENASLPAHLHHSNLCFKQKGQFLMQVSHFLRETTGRMPFFFFLTDSSIKFV